jgi:hypothetical protein
VEFGHVDATLGTHGIRSACVRSAVCLGPLGARLAHVLRYADAYITTPWALVDAHFGMLNAAALQVHLDSLRKR